MLFLLLFIIQATVSSFPKIPGIFQDSVLNYSSKCPVDRGRVLSLSQFLKHAFEEFLLFLIFNLRNSKKLLVVAVISLELYLAHAK